jgi:hypothetical protein
MGSFHEATQAQMHIVEVERGQERAPYKEGECEERTCALTYMARSLLPEDDVVKASSPNAVTPSVAANTLNRGHCIQSSQPCCRVEQSQYSQRCDPNI